MKTCNCTLAGTKACENCEDCSIFVSPSLTDFNWVRVYPWVETYNPETHELVEKKEAKINRIKASIEASERQKNNNLTLIKQANIKIKEFGDNILICNEDINELKQELRKLED